MADVPRIIQDITSAHVDSFDDLIEEDLDYAVKTMEPRQFEIPNTQDRVALQISRASLGMPTVEIGGDKRSGKTSMSHLYPAECRQGRSTYKARLQLSVAIFLNGKFVETREYYAGEVPVMVRSRRCNLHRLKQAQLVKVGEEPMEMGGYFIVNGNERIIRMLLVQRRNFPLALKRPRWKTRGQLFTEYGVTVRSVLGNHCAVTNTLHYLSSGFVSLNFTHNREMFFVPFAIILKGLCDVPDRVIYNALTRGYANDEFFKGAVQNMLIRLHDDGLHTQEDVLAYLGKHFRAALWLPAWFTDKEVGQSLLKRTVCVHLEAAKDKFNFLVHMCQKLFALVRGAIKPDSPDNPMYQEVSMPGHIYLMLLTQRMEMWLRVLSTEMVKRAKKKDAGAASSIIQLLQSAAEAGREYIGRSMEYFLATGNIQSQSGIGLPQNSGLTVLADKLNYLRYISHFRSVHRGAYFAQMRTTSVRKLLPEAWGFICPVHTPDGAPCGLLNHLAASCKVVATSAKRTESLLLKYMGSFGLVTMDQLEFLYHSLGELPYPVVCDGKVMGYLSNSNAGPAAEYLRSIKVQGTDVGLYYTEICFVPHTEYCSIYPGLYVFSSAARMVRPVRNLKYGKDEYIGVFEQVYLMISLEPQDFAEGVATHQELRADAMLSITASFTPFSDFNQSPRNVYQCQMGKQTMGTPCLALSKRSDNKLYRIQTPQSPLVRSKTYETYNIDQYPLGTNAVVAVISYTGYDMEDAMIINKGSYQRGFAHGCVYKCETHDLRLIGGGGGGGRRSLHSTCSLIYQREPITKANDNLAKFMDADGLPYIGVQLQEGDPYCQYMDIETQKYTLIKYKHAETAYVDQVRILGSRATGLHHISVVLRIQRNPIVGDKFASRHGQKGICSHLWPVENMPFTESGLTPDIIFNPHGFPSRMTIGMMIESMAGKAAALHGCTVDATPFQFDEEKGYNGADYFGDILCKAGYNYYGNERMYSGVDGREFEVDIFFGVVYYQRLRHMVADKFQVRSTGPVDALTHQPVHGRKRGGGVRFGEMERDSLLAHGAAYLLQDRLFNCSDKDIAYVCEDCGCFLSVSLQRGVADSGALQQLSDRRRMMRCSLCKSANSVHMIALPYVFRYLVNELAAVNIKILLGVK